jgi:zinc resistance-associated protein
MWNAVLVGAATVVIAGSSVVFAQQMQGEAKREQPPALSQQEDTGVPNGRFAARLASLKASLRLTPEQEKNWAAYQAALQALTNLRRERMEARQQQGGPTDPMQRLRQRAETLGSLAAALSRVANAQEPLYNSLDEAQKRRFAEFTQMRGNYSEMPRSSPARDDDDRRGSRGRDDDSDRRWRSRDDDSDRRWRSRDDDYDRRGWRGRSDTDRRGWRGRDDDDDYDRRGWRGRDDDDDCDCRGWRGRDDDDNRRGRSED